VRKYIREIFMTEQPSSVIHDLDIPLERRVISLIMCVATEKRCEIERAIEGVLQSYVQIKLLHALAEAPEGRTTVGELSRRIEEPIPNVSRTVSKLVALGFVEKNRSTEDQRTVHVRVTKAGRLAQREADARLLDVTTGLERSELKKLFDLLLKVYEHTEMRWSIPGRERSAR
jgi:DNA-binding MarR family transcriptional regulator